MSAILRLFSKKSESVQTSTAKRVSSNPQKAALEAKITTYQSVLKNLTRELRDNNEFLARLLDCPIPDANKLKRGKAAIATKNTALATRISNCQVAINTLENQLAEGDFSHSVFQAE